MLSTYIETLNVSVDGVIEEGYIPDNQIYTEIYLNYNGSTLTVVIILSALSLAFLIACLIVIVIYRRSMVVVATNEVYCYSILLGTAIGFIDLFLWIGRPNDDKCDMRLWLLIIGFLLVFGAIATKTTRIWRLWSRSQMGIRTFEGKKIVLIPLLFIWLLQITLLSILSALDWYKVQLVSSGDLKFDEYYVICKLNPNGSIIIYVLIAINSVLVVITAILAYHIRNVSRKFNELPSIGLSIYSVLISGLVVFVLVVWVDTSQPLTQDLFVIYGVCISFTVPLFSIFVPKFGWLYKELQMKGPISSIKTVTLS
eukprot:TRINITY_DN305_c0_g3_i1.p1 TRINITY_DN305_c0_g3~~TRINITY_DN305_c0_g3_i1.p1  ORF type:complete len:312 (+),score=7.06 TRINITY_DN305_c0_g3_i1:225-1160(+)